MKIVVYSALLFLASLRAPTPRERAPPGVPGQVPEDDAGKRRPARRSPDIYKVVLDGQIFYTDDKASYLFSGNLLDMRGASLAISRRKRWANSRQLRSPNRRIRR